MPTDRESDPSAPADPAGRMLERLLDLAHDASSYLRHHRRAAVRTAAALLVAASLAACNGSRSGETDQQDTIAPLTSEVRAGLPSAPGRYPVDPSSLRRDSQGVYHFAWSQAGGAWQQADASLLKLVQDQTDELEVPASGDPTLHLREDTPVALADAAVAVATPVPGSSSDSGPSTYVPWYPFYGSSSSSSPSYRNPPSTTDDSNVARGSDSSASPPPPASRTSGLPHAVSGQGKGTGSGTAASGKSGASASSSSGQSGGTGGGDAASSKGSSSSGGGVGGAKSGGFSGGGGSGGGGGSSGGGSGS
jgi:hypothetical protein